MVCAWMEHAHCKAQLGAHEDHDNGHGDNLNGVFEEATGKIFIEAGMKEIFSQPRKLTSRKFELRRSPQSWLFLVDPRFLQWKWCQQVFVLAKQFL